MQETAPVAAEKISTSETVDPALSSKPEEAKKKKKNKKKNKRPVLQLDAPEFQPTQIFKFDPTLSPIKTLPIQPSSQKKPE